MHYVTILGNVRSNSLFNRITHCKNSCENSIRSRTINMQGTQGGAASNVCFGSDICFRIKCSPRLRKTLFRSPLPLKLCHPPYMIHEAHSIRRHPMARHSANHRPVKSCLVIRWSSRPLLSFVALLSSEARFLPRVIYWPKPWVFHPVAPRCGDWLGVAKAGHFIDCAPSVASFIFEIILWEGGWFISGRTCRVGNGKERIRLRAWDFYFSCK